MDKEVIIITGSCGRIGQEVTKRLGEKYRIVGFELLKAIYASANEELVPVDLSSDESVHQAFTHIRQFYGTKIAAIIHLAAYYSFDEKESPLYEKITVKGTERLLKAAQDFEVDQFLFSSTMLVYAPCQNGQKICEGSPVKPTWGYPASKIKTEKLIHNLRGKMKSVILRIAGVYDNLCHSIPISHQIQRIYEKKLESRLFPGDTSHGAAFLHMTDLVDAIELAVDKRHSLPDDLILLLGEPVTYSYAHLQERITALLHHKAFHTRSISKWLAKIGAWFEGLLPMTTPFIKPWMIDFADDHYALDISKAKEVLGWQPKKDLDKTLPLMIEALQKDPVHWYKINGLPLPRFLK